MQGREPFEKQAAEETRQNAHGQEEAGLAGDPARPVRRQGAAGNDDVDMGMMGERRAPGVQHGGQADARAQMLPVGGEGSRRLGGGPEQEVVDGGLVLERDRADRSRQGEDDVTIGTRQKLRLALGEPLPRRRALTLRAVTVAAGIVGARSCAQSSPRSCAQSSPRSTWPPSAAVRQVSIADMTFSWPRPTWPGRGRAGGARLARLTRVDGDAGVERGRLQLGVAEQRLDHASNAWITRATLGSRGCRRSARADGWRSCGARCAARPAWRSRPLGVAAWTARASWRADIGLTGFWPGNSQALRPRRAPPVAQQFEPLRRAHHIAVPPPLAVLDPKRHALAVEVGHLQRHDLRHPLGQRRRRR